jgi:hypothetical protein
MLDYISNCF